MCNLLINRVYKCELDGTAKAVLLFLADQVRAKKDVDRCYPSVKFIARATGFSERTVRYKLNELEAAGHITREFRSYTSTVYQVHPGRPCIPANSAGVQSLPLPPANDDKTPCNSCRQTNMNQKNNRGARPIGMIARQIVSQHRAEEKPADGDEQVSAEEVQAFRENYFQ